MTTIFAIITEAGKSSILVKKAKDGSVDSGEYSFLQQSFCNLAEFVDDKNIILNTEKKYSFSVKKQLKVIGQKFSRKKDYNIFSSQFTEHGILSLAFCVKSLFDNLTFTNKDAVIFTAPASYSVCDRKKLAKFAQKGLNLAKAGYIVSFSFNSENTEKEVKYLKTRKTPKITEIEPEALKVTGFETEKSDKNDKDSVFLLSSYYMFTTETFFSEIKKHLPELYKILFNGSLQEIKDGKETDLFKELSDKTFDETLLSASKKIVTLNVEGSFVDTDILYEKDNSASETEIIELKEITDVEDLCNKFLFVSGEEVFITESDDVNKINSDSSDTTLLPQKVERPWGTYSVLNEGSGYLTKCISVNPGQKLSLQFHHHRTERWFVINGVVNAIKDKENLTLNKGDFIDIAKEEIHSLQNLSEEVVRIFEIQQGDILDENDIVRLEDIYGRI